MFLTNKMIMSKIIIAQILQLGIIARLDPFRTIVFSKEKKP